MFMKAFHEANVGDAMAKQAQTFTGATSTISDNLKDGYRHRVQTAV
jgi:hypothetical protein